MLVIGVPTVCVPAYWHRVSHLVDDALSYGNGEYWAEDILAACSSGDMQLWATDKSFAVTTLIVYPRRVTCLIALAGGDLDDLRQSLPLVEEWARHQGCDGIEVMGRKGWLKALPDYQQAQVHLRKDLGCIPSSEVH